MTAIDYAILDAVEQDAAGFRAPRIGEIYATGKVDGSKELLLQGNVYSRAAWPLVEGRFMSPHPRAGQFVLTTGTISTDSTFFTYSKLAYNRFTDTLVCMYLLHNGYGFARSTDRGAAWSVVAPSGLLQSQASPVIAIKYSTKANCLLVARERSGGGFAIDRSADDGTTWTNVLTGGLSVASNSYVQGDSFEKSARGDLVETADGWLFVTSNSANNASVVVYKSVDNGLTWTSHVVATGNNLIGVPRIFKSNGRYVIIVRDITGPNYSSVFSCGTNFADVKTEINYSGAHPVIAHHRYSLLQLGEDIFGFTGFSTPGAYTLVRYDIGGKTLRTTQLHATTMVSTNPILAKLNDIDAVVLSGGYNGADESFYNLLTNLRDLRATNVSTDPNVIFSTAPAPSQLGLPFNITAALEVDMATGPNGLIFLKMRDKLYVSTSTYQSEFQTPQLTGSGYMQAASPTATSASPMTQVMRGA